jgi:hypothetical protein
MCTTMRLYNKSAKLLIDTEWASTRISYRNTKQVGAERIASTVTQRFSMLLVDGQIYDSFCPVATLGHVLLVNNKALFSCKKIIKYIL